MSTDAGQAGGVRHGLTGLSPDEAAARLETDGFNEVTRERRPGVAALLLGQSVDVAVCHFGIWKQGGVSLPLFTLFGEEALEYRLENSGAVAVVTDRANLPKVLAVIKAIKARKWWTAIKRTGAAIACMATK